MDKPSEKPIEQPKQETEAEREVRINKCVAEIEKVLADNNCVLTCYFILNDRGNKSVIKVVSK